MLAYDKGRETEDESTMFQYELIAKHQEYSVDTLCMYRSGQGSHNDGDNAPAWHLATDTSILQSCSDSDLFSVMGAAGRRIPEDTCRIWNCTLSTFSRHGVDYVVQVIFG